MDKHFQSANHHGGTDMELYILDFIHAHPASEFSLHLHNEFEFHWIQRLGTMLPFGINTIDRMPDPSQSC